ncbi:MAG: chlorite dismutase family protein [Pyrinomonadaceae bacterium]|nr:chlorite dismutase family protein [Phycisphaerales bacterium]
MGADGSLQIPVSPVRVSFVAGSSGDWRIDRVSAVRGASLPGAAALSRTEGASFDHPSGALWILNGVRSNERYVERAEKRQLGSIQEGLGRPTSRTGALIPIQKNDAWWDLPQDERRAIFEAQSRHIAIGMKYLPAVARRLYHCRDLGEPFDFLTWFEFDPANAAAFDDLLGHLRATEEWRYVAREVEIRVSRDV